MAAFAEPMVRIRLPPGESPQTIGSAGDFTGSFSGYPAPPSGWFFYVGNRAANGSSIAAFAGSVVSTD